MTATLPGNNVEITVTPDKVFGLDFTYTGRRTYFVVEADRSTMIDAVHDVTEGRGSNVFLFADVRDIPNRRPIGNR